VSADRNIEAEFSTHPTFSPNSECLVPSRAPTCPPTRDDRIDVGAPIRFARRVEPSNSRRSYLPLPVAAVTSRTIEWVHCSRMPTGDAGQRMAFRRFESAGGTDGLEMAGTERRTRSGRCGAVNTEWWMSRSSKSSARDALPSLFPLGRRLPWTHLRPPLSRRSWRTSPAVRNSSPACFSSRGGTCDRGFWRRTALWPLCLTRSPVGRLSPPSPDFQRIWATRNRPPVEVSIEPTSAEKCNHLRMSRSHPFAESTPAGGPATVVDGISRV
jgi:hypothetical protein